MNARQLAELAPVLKDRLELATGGLAEFIGRVAGVALDAKQRAALKDLLAWHLAMAASAGVAHALASSQETPSPGVH